MADLKFVVLKSLPIVRNFSGEFLNYGASVYRGVMVFWDRDYDKRIIQFIDEHLDSIGDNSDPGLIAAYEHEGMLSLLYKNYIPGDVCKEGVSVCGDFWTVEAELLSSK